MTHLSATRSDVGLGNNRSGCARLARFLFLVLTPFLLLLLMLCSDAFLSLLLVLLCFLASLAISLSCGLLAFRFSVCFSLLLLERCVCA